MMKKELSSKATEGGGIGGVSNTLFYYKKILIFILGVGLLIIFFFPVNILQASNYRTGEYLKGWLVKKGNEFSIDYIHSVQLTPVIEIYSIDENNNIVLKESYFYSYGAGLPSTTPYQFEITEEGFRIYDINEIMDDLIYRTGAVRANHQINIGKEIYPFLSFSEPRAGIKFSVRKLFLLQYLVKEVAR